ncbi:spore gernimation protein [Halobacillus trueperi]|uniref:Spore germination protein (Amino acid permease) n=2 Tax=Halobacillus TaxID=45667 RepID=A0A1H0QZS5_HALAD|nr:MULTISPECIES: GerAB/ArcD/ProY family transporter [Halobacillus]RDY70252.1 spore gernimation protein [Halobacillus trueperi]SDP22761.1 spore germination protein (amino acid permease) [Halobacillus aidingensis]
MKTNIPFHPDRAVQAFYLFFIIHTSQIGAGLMGVPRILVLEAGVDAWISVLIAGLYLHLVVFIMLQILKSYENADILGIQQDLFGVWIGKTLGTVYVLYIFLLLLTVIKNYIEVVQVFVFPEMPIWLMALFLLSLMVYSILGGFRVVVGTSVIFFFLTIWLVFTIYKPITYMDWEHFLPVFRTPAPDLLKGVQQVTFSVLGLEILFFVYPFIQDKKRAALPAHAGVFFTTFLILLVTVVSIGYFSPDQLKAIVWATLSLFKIISFSVLERFDFIAVALWMMVIIPNIVLFGWMIVHSLKRLFNAPKKPTLYGLAFLLFFTSITAEKRVALNELTNWTGEIGFWIVFVYPFLIYMMILLKKLMKKRNAS